jgi:hypothetical protein
VGIEGTNRVEQRFGGYVYVVYKTWLHRSIKTPLDRVLHVVRATSYSGKPRGILTNHKIQGNLTECVKSHGLQLHQAVVHCREDCSVEAQVRDHDGFVLIQAQAPRELANDDKMVVISFPSPQRPRHSKEHRHGHSTIK